MNICILRVIIWNVIVISSIQHVIVMVIVLHSDVIDLGPGVLLPQGWVHMRDVLPERSETITESLLSEGGRCQGLF